MRCILFCFLICVSAVPVFAQHNNWVVLSGNTRNFNNQVQVEDMSEMSNLILPDASHYFIPDSTGHFSIGFALSSANYFRVGRNILYLTPGDSLTVFIDYKDPKLAVFSGKHSQENEYLRETPFPKGGSFLEAGTRIKTTVDSTVMAIEEAAKQRAMMLSGYSGKAYPDLSREFVKLETARIRADLMNSVIDIGVYFPMRKKMKKESADSFHTIFDAELDSRLKRYNENFIDPDFLKLVVYRDIVDELVKKEKGSPEKIQQIKDWMMAHDIAQQLKSASDKESKIKLEPEIRQVKNAVYREALNTTLQQALQLSNGDMAVDFSAADPENKTVHPSAFKGKLIYIDLWATWCGPCMEEMPAFEKLKDIYKDNPDIRFISLSIDDDKQRWKESIQKRNAQGNQWIIDRAKLDAYHIIGIPRTIIMDANFHIADMNAPLPSSKNLVTRLTELLK